MATTQGRATPMRRARLTPKPCLVGILGEEVCAHRTLLPAAATDHAGITCAVIPTSYS